MMDDQERYLGNIQPPNQDEWNRQIYKLQVFNLLAADTDSNLTNMVISLVDNPINNGCRDAGKDN
jgi:hypothetical protein